MALPSKSFRDPEFRYRRAVETDIRKTFARVRRELAEQARAAQEQPHAVVTLPLHQRGAKG